MSEVIGFQNTGNGGRIPVSSAQPLPVTDSGNTANGVLIGAVTETAPTTDTASSGLNGRLQRIAQRITSLIALLPASIGLKAAAGSVSVTLASDDAAIGAPAATAYSGSGSSSIIAILKAMYDFVFSVTGIDSVYTLNCAATTNAVVVKASPGRLFGVDAFSPTGGNKYVKIYDLATTPNPASDVPVMAFLIGGTNNASPRALAGGRGYKFATGIAIVIVTGAALTDTTAPAAGDVQLLLTYR